MHASMTKPKNMILSFIKQIHLVGKTISHTKITILHNYLFTYVEVRKQIVV